MPSRSELPGAEKPRSKKPKFTKEAADARLMGLDPSRLEALSDDEMTDEVVTADDAVREAKKRLQIEEKKEKFRAMSGQRVRPEDVTRAEEALGLAEARWQTIKPFAEKRFQKSLLDHASFDDVDLSDINETIGAESDKKRELSDRKQALEAEDEHDLKTVEQAFKARFESELAAAEQDSNLRLAVQDHKELAHRRDWLEREIKQRTGHEADSIDLDASLMGGTWDRVRDRTHGWLSKLAGKQPAQTPLELMNHWRKVNAELEELSVQNAEMQAATARDKTNESPETKRPNVKAKERKSKLKTARKEAGRQIADEILEAPEQTASFEKTATLRLTEGLEEMGDLMKELGTLEDDELLARQASLQEEVANLYKSLKAQEGSGEIADEASRRLLKEAWDTLEQLGAKYDERYEALTNQARRAGKGERIKGVTRRGSRIEHYARQAPKTERNLEDELAMEVSAYRTEHAADIKRAMQENPRASAIWNEISTGVSELIEPKQEALRQLFGTRDIATAYVLNLADESKILEANKILQLKPSANLETKPVVESNAAEYQAKHAADIKRVMKEFPKASEMWQDVSKQVANLTADKRNTLAKIFGTRDIATAYVLNAADYQMESGYAKQAMTGNPSLSYGEVRGLDAEAKANQMRVIDANVVLGLLPHMNLETKLQSVEAGAQPIPLVRAKKYKGAANKPKATEPKPMKKASNQ